MAISKKIKGITIQFNGDTTNLGKALGDVESTVISTESELKKVNKALKDIDPNNTVLLAQKQDILNEAIEASKKKLKGLENAQGQVEKQFKSGDIGADAYREFQRTIEATKKKLNGLETESDNLKKAQREMANNGADFAKEKIEGVGKAAKTEGKKINDLGDDFKNAEKDARSFGGGIDAAQVALGNLAADGIKGLGSALKDYAADSQTASNSFAAQTGATAEEMQKYSGVIDELYKNSFGDSKNDVANAMALVKQTVGETDADKLKEMTENAMTLSDTFGFDVAEQLRAVNMLTKQFGISSDEAYNLIVQGAQKGLNKNGDLLDTINEYAVHYKQLGYTSDEFFNSLANGTASGTFSVDKLGDAVKEFGIRSKDTAKTTTDALALLGYSSGAADEEVAKVTDEIAKLEKNLKYAKLEQENFNDKTSELTRLKNADKIKEYSKSLDTAKKKLQALKDSSDSSGESISDLQTRFAAGGETAKKATDEVLEKLFSMDDQVSQNAAGVGLFGTMWEDLGKDGVEALMNTNGEIDKTEEALQKVKDVKYDDITTEITGLGREFQDEILKPVIEDFMPDIKNGMKWLKDNLPALKPLIKGIGTVAVTAFAVNKVSNFTSSVGNLISTAKSATTAIKGIGTASTIAGSAGLIGLAPFIAGFAAIGAGMWYMNEQQKKWESNTDEFIAVEQKRIDKIDEEYKSWSDTKKARDDLVSDTTAEYKYYEELKKELDGIVDSSGKVKSGYEGRAQFITNELEKVTGLEIQYNDGVIENYKTLSGEIDKALKLKKAEAMLGAYDESYTNAIKNKNEYWSEMNKTAESIKKKEAELKAIPWNDASGENYTRRRQLQNDLAALRKAHGEQEQMYLDALSTIQNYESLSEAIISGNVETIQQAEALLTNNFQTAENGTEQSLKNQVNSYKQAYENMKIAVQEGAPGVTEEQLRQQKELYLRSKFELNNFKNLHEKSGKDNVQAMIKGTGEEMPNYRAMLSKNMQEELYGAVQDVEKDAQDAGRFVGENIALGTTLGIQGQSNLLTGAAFEAAQKSVEGFKITWGINSPSKVGRSLGDYFMQGLSLGFSDGQTKLGNTVGSIGSDTISTLKNQLDNLPTVSLNARYTAAVKSGNITPALSGSRMFNITIGEFVNNTDHDIDSLVSVISTKLQREIAQTERGMGW